jgi:hypothetical protein
MAAVVAGAEMLAALFDRDRVVAQVAIAADCAEAAGQGKRVTTIVHAACAPAGE